MTSLVSFSRGRPQCLACMRRALNCFNDAWLPAAHLQIRGKKKLAKSTTIKVRLLADIPQYGRKGRIVPISPGRMRNDFYPKKKAEYMTATQLRATGIQESAIERDSTFGSRQDRFVALKPEGTDNPIAVPHASSNVVEVDLLKPEQATTIISKVIPKNIDFYRSPIATTSPTPSRRSPSIPAIAAISVAAQDVVSPQKPQKATIYGSVSTADIVENIKAILAEDGEGSRVVLTPEDIAFVSQEEEKDRVKHLGIFEIDIKVKGATVAVRRTITVKAQE